GKTILNDVIALKNDSMGSAIPAYAVVACKDVVDDSKRVLVEKPSEGPSTYLVNGPGEIPGGGFGYAQSTELLVVLYQSDASPSPGDLYGPIPDQWYCGPDTAEPIFVVLGVVDASRKILLARMIHCCENNIFVLENC